MSFPEHPQYKTSAPKSMFETFKEEGLCPRCELPAFAAESKTVNGYKFHESCFFCSVCKTGLTSLNVAAKECEIFCNKCYGRTYGVRGYGYGLGAGALSMTMTSIKHQDCVQPIHNQKTNVGKFSQSISAHLDQNHHGFNIIDPADSIKTGRYMKATPHDHLKTSNVPKTCEAYCFPRAVTHPLPSESLTLGRSERMMQERAKVVTSGLPPNTIATMPVFKHTS